MGKWAVGVVCATNRYQHWGDQGWGAGEAKSSGSGGSADTGPHESKSYGDTGGNEIIGRRTRGLALSFLE